MAFLLWLDEEADDAIDLGDPFVVLPAFQEIVEALNESGDADRFAELCEVPAMGEQQVDDQWLAKVRKQAAKAASKIGSSISDEAEFILQLLADDPPKEKRTVKPTTKRMPR